MTRTEVLTEREQQALEQMREAQAQGSTLKAYAEQKGLNLGQLYDLRRRLVRKGAFGAQPLRKPRKSRKASAFAPVRVVSATSVPGGSSIRCRVLHPSGWVLECDGLPPAPWVAAVLTGGAHAAS
jgi:hypothetical protein